MLSSPVVDGIGRQFLTPRTSQYQNFMYVTWSCEKFNYFVLRESLVRPTTGARCFRICLSSTPVWFVNGCLASATLTIFVTVFNGACDIKLWRSTIISFHYLVMIISYLSQSYQCLFSFIIFLLTSFPNLYFCPLFPEWSSISLYRKRSNTSLSYHLFHFNKRRVFWCFFSSTYVLY